MLAKQLNNIKRREAILDFTNTATNILAARKKTGKAPFQQLGHILTIKLTSVGYRIKQLKT